MRDLLILNFCQSHQSEIHSLQLRINALKRFKVYFLKTLKVATYTEGGGKK